MHRSTKAPRQVYQTVSTEMATAVVKRDGRREPVSFDKILRRVTSLCDGLKAEGENYTKLNCLGRSDLVTQLGITGGIKAFPAVVRL